MAGSYFDMFLVDESQDDFDGMVEPYAIEMHLPAEVTGGAAGSPPVVTILSPTPGGTAARTAPLVFTVVDADGLTLERAMIRSGGSVAKWEQAYRDGAACAGYSVTRTAITDGYRYEITREGGWNAGALELEPVFGDPTASASINT